MSTRFHAGEIVLQKATGAYERMTVAGPRVIRDFMPDQHRELFEKLPILFVGTLADDGHVWATVVSGSPGFVNTPDDRTLRVGATLDRGDPAKAGLKVGSAIGLLGLESSTRRRNRANGVIVDVGEESFTVAVNQSFGNCPKYIYSRESLFVNERIAHDLQPLGTRLDSASLELIASSDTLFIASSSAGRFSSQSEIGADGEGVDVSHRGGFRGFVTVDQSQSADRLTMPDYVGNYMFNTLGNLHVWPHAGLLFIDWQRGDLLQLAVDVDLQTEGAAMAAFPGAQRLVHMTVVRGVFRAQAMALSWTDPVSPPQFSDGSPLHR